MKLVFLGTGSAFTVGDDNYNSNMLLIHDNGEKLLIDCGSDARLSLYEQGYTYKDIKDVYISHLHADHAGGLEWLGFTRFFDPKCKKPNLYIIESLMTELWENCLKAGMSSLQGRIADLTDFFNTLPIKENDSFLWQDIQFKVIQTIHVMNAFSLIPSHGLIFKLNDKKIFITTDTQFTPHLLNELYEEADLIFHDCETVMPHSNVHAHYNQLKGLAKHVKAKMWLYHYNPGELPDAQADGFLGFAKKGQIFDI